MNPPRPRPASDPTQLLSKLARRIADVQGMATKLSQDIMTDFSLLTLYANDHIRHDSAEPAGEDLQAPEVLDYTKAKHEAVVVTARDHILGLEKAVMARKTAFVRDMRDLLKKVEDDGR